MPALELSILLGVILALVVCCVMTALLQARARARRRVRDRLIELDRMRQSAARSAAAQRIHRTVETLRTQQRRDTDAAAALQAEIDRAHHAAYGYNETEAQILAGPQPPLSPADHDALIAAHVVAQSDVDTPRPDSPRISEETIARMRAGQHLVWRRPGDEVTVTRLDAADTITPALERRLRQMMRDEITRARAREMGGG